MAIARAFVGGLLFACGALTAAADEGTAATTQPAAPPPPCKSEAYRQFDFWIGDWEVTSGGQLAGHNRIEAVLGGCALHENWTGARGNQGYSYNAWDAPSQRWRQFWVDASGLVLRLEGGWNGKAMVLEGELPTSAGGRQLQRISWTPNADGSVRQHWETSDDDGKAWATSFDGLYRKRDATATQ